MRVPNAEFYLGTQKSQTYTEILLSGPFWYYLSRYQVVKVSLCVSVISVRKIIAPCVPRKHVPFGERITAVGLSAVRRLVVFRAPSGCLQSAVWLSSERRLAVVRVPSGLSSECRLPTVRAPSADAACAD